MKSKKYFLIAILYLCHFFLGSLWALTPDELVLLVNKNAPESMEVANYFIALRNIPPENIVLLEYPKPHASSMSVKDFEQFIWTPTQKAISERSLTGHILAWVYAPGFPTKISASPPMSLMGLTFSKNKVPESNIIKAGKYISPFFSGPGPENSKVRFRQHSFSLDRFYTELKDQMPIPSMMLGYTGARGNRVDTLVEMLEKSIDTDSLGFDGSIYFWKNMDVRSRCRHWQFPEVVRELNQMDISAYLNDTDPPRKEPILGLLTGKRNIDTTAFTRIKPGSMAEHLTSFAACFFTPSQTKCTSWIKAGATGTAGTITEPFANWTKFPHARFFIHYGRGCSMLDSFYQALCCPFQLLILGDPLAEPGAPDIQLKIFPQRRTGETVFTLTPLGIPKGLKTFFRIYLNGKIYSPITSGTILRIPDKRLIHGHNELRIITVTDGPIEYYAQTVFEWGYWPGSERLKIVTPEDNANIAYHRPLQLSWKTPRNVQLLRVKKGLLTLKECNPLKTSTVMLDPSLMGRGPNRIHLEGITAQGNMLRSHPVLFIVKDQNKAPQIGRIQREKISANTQLLTPKISDPEDDKTQISWHVSLLSLMDSTDVKKHKFKKGSDSIEILSTSTYDIVIFNTPSLLKPHGMSAYVSWKSKNNLPSKELSYMVYNYKDKKNFCFFGMHGYQSAWVVGKCENGSMKILDAAGQPISLKKKYFMQLNEDEKGVSLWIDGVQRCSWPGGQIDSGECGLLGGPGSATRFIIPTTPVNSFPFSLWIKENFNGTAQLLPGPGMPSMEIWLRAYDGFDLAEKKIHIKGYSK